MFAISCGKKSGENQVDSNDNELKYTQKIRLTESQDSVFIQYSNSKIGFSKVELPLESAMVVPTSVIAYMDALGVSHKISGVSQIDFVYNSKIQQKFQNKKLIEIGNFNEIFIEKIIVQKPDIFIAQSGPTLAKYYEVLKNEGIKLLYIDEFEESTPLAKAEYLKIIGKLFGKEKESKELFEEIESNYFEIKEIANSRTPKPKVVSNHIYGDIWYMPGGKSFQSVLFEDAGADYYWANTTNESVLYLSFESVFEKASKADYWVNAGDFSTLSEMLATYKNYEWFSAIKNKQVYNWSKRSSPSGANDYFENGVVRPDWVLKDLAAIFHPELFPEHELFFYKRLE